MLLANLVSLLIGYGSVGALPDGHLDLGALVQPALNPPPEIPGEVLGGRAELDPLIDYPVVELVDNLLQDSEIQNHIVDQLVSDNLNLNEKSVSVKIGTLPFVMQKAVSRVKFVF